MSNPNDSIFTALTNLTSVTPEVAKSLDKTLGIKTVFDLAVSPHFTFAAEIVDAAADPHHALRRFGIPRRRIAKPFAKKPLDELPDAPLSALEGIGKPAERQLTKALGVKTIRELGLWPPFIRAREIFANAVRDGVISGDPKIFRVSGFVVRVDRSPVVGAELKFFRLGITKVTALGSPNTARTNANGGYIFEYERPDVRIDLRVELIADPNNNVGETRPRVILQASEDERADFVVGDAAFRGPSTFERLEVAVGKLLGSEGIKAPEIADFDEETLARLALKVGIEPRTLVLLRQSYALAKETKLPAELLFGMGREKIPLGLPALLVQDPDKRRAAVKAAFEANHIPAHLEKVAASVLARLDELMVADALKQPTTPDVTTLGSLLGSAEISSAKQKKLADSYVKHAGTNKEFWTTVESSGVLTENEVKQVQFTLQLAAVTQNHAPLVQALTSQGISDLKGLATLSKADWLDLIKGSDGNPPMGMPADLKAAGVSDEDYAEMIFRVAEDALPTAMVVNRISNFPDPIALRAFFDRNPDFDLRTTPVRTYLETNPNALDFAASEAEREGVEKRLKGLERAYRIAPPGARVETMEVLLKDGLDSAQKVRVLGRAAFVRRYDTVFGRERAEKVWARANNASALATTVLARHSALFDRTPIHVLPKRIEKLDEVLPSYEAMFGSLDFCSCEHCLSVFGPAAYLTDVLHWLDNRVLQSGTTALDALFDDRRADIGTIELSCTNTNTPLPYIDLVNEVLELTVAPADPAPEYQTTGSAADLRAHPEHLHNEAYAVLAGAREGSPGGKDAIYPFNLPFNLWIEEARTYLGQLGVSRYRLMEVLQGEDSARLDPVVAAETLGMSPLEWDLIAGNSLGPSRTVAAFWGMPGDDDFTDKLIQVSLLLEHATPPIAENSMEFEELADLLRADFVQEPVPVGVLFDSETCDTTKARLVGLGEESLKRIHRFIRLRRRLDWSALDLDRAIQVLGEGTLDESCLIKVAHVRRLATQLHLPIGELLTWWGPLDTRRWTNRLKRGVPSGAPPGVHGPGLVFDNQLTEQPEDGEDASPYDQLFQTTSTSAEPNKVFGVNPDGDALADETAELVEQVPAVAGALGVTAEDLVELLSLLDDGRLSLSNLSALYRHVSLARSLGLKVRDLVSLLALTGIEPFDVAHTENALALLDEARTVRASGLSVGELDYLLRHRDTKPATLEPEDVDIGVLFFELGDALRKVEVDHPLPIESASADDLREQLEKELQIVLATADLAEALAIMDLKPSESPPPGAEVFIEDKLKEIFDPEDAKQKLVDEDGPDYINDRRDRLEYALRVVVTLLRRLGEASAVIEKMATAVGLDHAIAAPLLREHLKHPDVGGQALLDVFADDAVRLFPTKSGASDEPVLPGTADLPDQFAAYKRLHKAAIVLNRLRIRKEELAWVLVQGPTHGTLDFQDLPVAIGGSTPLYPGLRRLLDAIAIRDRFSPRELVDLFEAAASAEVNGTAVVIAKAHEDLLTELERRSRWDRADIEFLVGTPARPGNIDEVAGALGFAYPTDWKDERPLTRLAEVLAVVRRVGLSAATLMPWRTIPASIEAQSAQADEIKQALRARHEQARWYEVATTLRDRLRERQRDALVGWLVGNDPRFADANALFAHLLIDVEMSACQLTSRIKQAISTVQLFVQRALMGLEVDGNGVPPVALSNDDADEWEWMKSYRVWEANRKVFLYPENWIEPELRDNKTPFFKELEDELLQSEVTAESAERAVRSYLEKLDQVARLEVTGLFHQNDDATDILHVFGRTRGTPPIYYYRQRVDGTYWTPWKKVDVDIEGDHLIPVVFNRRLYIFWALITESAVEEKPKEISGDRDKPPQPEQPKRYYQIRLAWSQLAGEGWSSKKIARPFIGQDVLDLSDVTAGIRKESDSSPSDFFIRAYVDEQKDLLVESIRRSQSTFHGKVLKLKPKPGQLGSIELPPLDSDPQVVAPTDSLVYIFLPRFRISGCDGTVTIEVGGGKGATVRTPPNTEVANQAFVRITGAQGLALPSRNPVTSAINDEPTLDVAKPPFEIVPQRLDDFQSRGAFFFQDRNRTFFIEPRTQYSWTRPHPDWSVATNVSLDIAAILPEFGPRPESPAPDPLDYDSTAIATLPEAINVLAPANALDGAGTGSGLAAFSLDALKETFGSHVEFVAGDAVQPTSSALTLGIHVRVVGPNGQNLTEIRTATPPLAARALGGLVLDRTFEMPAVNVENPMFGPLLKPWEGTRYRFDTFYHPYLCTMMRELNRFGLNGLFDPDPDGPEPLLIRQKKKEEFFVNEYAPRAVLSPFPVDAFDFSYGGAYAIYNWEVFFHVPFLIACHLSKNQRFAEAQRWFHYIFDPTETEGDAPQRFWKVRPLFELFNNETADAGPIHELLLLLQYEGSEPDKLKERDEIIAQVADWRANPFNPHALARLRLAAYARAVVLKYIDNLIDWGDALFRRDTLESINEATLLYMLAAEILGRRPRLVAVEPPEPRTFDDLRGQLDEFSNALAEEVEGLLPEIIDTETEVYRDDVAVLGPTLFFCVPPNDKLLTDYWDRVADRLFKIRHCMNIEGIVRQLPLFEPPIDPALLVRATALGIDLASALSDLAAPLPFYRYQVLSQKATELCMDVRGLGQALLSALEKKDAEELALLRAGHEVKLQNAVLDVREKQIREARETLESLRRSKESAEVRRDYYRSRPYMNAAEMAQVGLSARAGLLEATAQGIQSAGSILANAPNLQTGGSGFGGSPVVTFSFGGMQLSFSAEAAAASLRINAAIADRLGQLSGLIGSYERRQDDWELQGDTAEKDIEVLERQIVAAEIRVAVADKELENLQLQVDQSKETEAFLRDKYTSDQLYQWMLGQLSSVYFQSYQLAYDMAKRAERVWQFELAIPGQSFIQFGYWDSLKKGLLAGDRLHHDLKRMEVAYLDQNRREYEITKHVSLSQLDPVAFALLRQQGSSTVSIPEVLFDLDYPGHFLRRLKSVGITIPCVTGPYTGVSCTLTLLKSSVRHSSALDNGKYARNLVIEDSRFTDNFGAIESIVTSSAQGDSGLFETNLRDERYLPFEGAGVISDWEIRLPTEFPSFDYDTISDVVLHLRYTAREGGDLLRNQASDELRVAVNDLVRSENEKGLARLFSLRHEFPSELHRFLNPVGDSAANNTVTVSFGRERFPFLVRDKEITIGKIHILIKVKPEFAKTHDESTIKVTLEAGDTAPTSNDHEPSDLVKLKREDGLIRGERDFNQPPGRWTMNMWLNDGDRVDRDAVSEIMFVCAYTVETPEE